MSDLLQRSQKQNPQPLLPVNNQSARALVQHAVHQVRHFFRRVKKTSVLELDPSSPQRMASMASRGSVRATVSFA
jgi:hypothetical protein